jgi:rare lipoprotein A
MTKTPSFRNLLPLLAASAMALMLNAPATAEKRGKAPIVYAAAETPARARPAKAGNSKSVSSPNVSKRVEFVYPDQPGVVYGAGQPARQSAPASGLSQLQGRQYASLSAPAAVAAPQSTAGTITSGGFDARAAAARAQQPVRPVTPAPVSAPVSAPVEQSALAPLVPVAQPMLLGSPAITPVFDETGVAVVYGEEFEGLPTANGEVYTASGMTAAHPSLPLPSLLHVVDEASGREVVVRVNDRGPFEDGATLQLSQRAAEVLGLGAAGQGRVKLRYLGPAPVASARAAAPAPAPSVQQTAYQPPVAVVPVRQPVRPSAPAIAGQYFVQVGAFSEIANAQDLQQTLARDLPVQIQAAEVNGADWFRVRVGPVDSRETAESLRSQLTANGLTGGRIVAAD